ncbi:MAG: PilZ domain-containing protein [Deltaproteobacteria bacterium]|nr:PilZ domain-containing protein [Deltaproteobacteria bacterium]
MNRVILAGPLIEELKKIIEDCGFGTVIDTQSQITQGLDDLHLYIIPEASGLAGLNPSSSEPFIIYSDIELPAEDISRLKEKGLMGVISGRTSLEDVAFLLNKAIFYNKMLKRNPRIPVSIPVELKAGSKVIRTTCSLLSRDGMFIVTLNPLPINYLCRLKFELAGVDGEMETEVRVLYNVAINKDLNIIANPRDPFKRLVSHPGMAVVFVDLAQEKRDLIDEYIKKME